MVTRRDFLTLGGKIVAGGAGYYTLKPLLDQLGGLVTGSQLQSEEKPKTLEEHVEDIQHKGWNAEKVIDYAGTANFAAGIGSLTKSNRIHPLNYAAAITGLVAKYLVTDETGKHHLIKELEEGYDALRVILGTTIAAEGIGLDLDAITMNSPSLKRLSTKEEKLFMMTVLPMLTSSLTTTVGSATIFREEVANYVDAVIQDGKLERKSKLYADLIAHIADNSGFLLVGDPPFIAMLQKYGPEGFMYQNKAMAPMVVYSGIRTMTKLSRYMGDDSSIDMRAAVKVMSDGKNWALLRNILKESGYNAGRGLKDLMTLNFDSSSQSEMGITVHPLSKIQEKIVNTYKLFRKEKVHGVEGMEAAEEEIDEIRKKAEEDLGFTDEFIQDLKGMGEKKYGLREAMKLANEYVVKAEWFDHFRHKLEHAYGSNMTDIGTVFPFQAGSIPFLQTVLKDYLKSIEDLNPALKDFIFYTSIAGFSSMADNYVACKLGLEVYPERPEVPLTAAIIGGSLLPPGNMANMALVSTKEHGLKEGFKELKTHADMFGAGFAYSEAIPYLRKIPVLGSLYDSSGLIKAMQQAE